MTNDPQTSNPSGAEEQPLTTQWYTHGYQGLAREQARQESGGEPRWFWMNPNAKQHIVMIDDDPVAFYMHEYRRGKEFNLHCTCIRDIYSSAPCCDMLGGDDSRVYFSLYTIVDLDGYNSKKNGNVRNVLTVLPAKYKTARLFESEKNDEKTLIGRRIRLERLTDKSPKSGDKVKCVPWQFGPEGARQEIQTLTDEHWKMLADRVIYRGKKLPEIIAAANKDAVKREALGRIFNLGPLTDKETGQLKTGMIPTFNFLEMYKPKPPKELAAILRGASAESFEERQQQQQGGGQGSGGDGASSSGGRSDNVPF